MPRYDFRCKACDKVEEHYAGMLDKPIGKCDACGGESKRLISCTHSIAADFASNDFVTDDISGEPVRITSNKQMNSLMKEHGVEPKTGFTKTEKRRREERNAHIHNNNERIKQQNL